MSELADALQADRKLWERHGILPNGERLALFLDGVAPAELADSDLVFLWIASAIAISEALDEEDLDAHVLFGELTDRIAAAAVPVSSLLDDLEPPAPDTRPDAVFGSTFMLDDGTRIQFERTVLPDGRRVLHGSSASGTSDVIEVTLIAGGACQIRSCRSLMAPE